MTELANCANCGRLFVKTVSPFCPECLKEQDRQFELVYHYITRQENRTATVPQVHEATGVKTDLIYQWVREGRLVPALFPNLGYPCRSCGTIIKEGVLCDNCRRRLEKEINQENAEQEKKDGRKRGKTYHIK
ncbi:MULTISPECIES: TIGR03826 family flagellar region protein [unclassified Sporolactobacillus]|uniref:TIGR03826 family flagellar region protein n=1 Tax=unclassified Sporolactobacillus TaxID=2628533 RepID=UPI002367A85D|nr:TIGR03826 family flagellar region protein [Sporolactobacillus sp. CQH2019]MDD9148048.1 hypothetical protein [Sporolactobacillus sp. CQH2019]